MKQTLGVWEVAMSVEHRAKTPRLPPRWFIRLAWSVHRGVYRVFAGRVGLWRPRANGWGTLRLTATGRRTGRQHSVIIGYFEDGPNLVSLATNGCGCGLAGAKSTRSWTPTRRGGRPRPRWWSWSPDPARRTRYPLTRTRRRADVAVDRMSPTRTRRVRRSRRPVRQTGRMSPASRGRKGKQNKKSTRRSVLPEVLSTADECDCPACSGADFDPQQLIDELIAGAADLVESEDPLDAEVVGAAFVSIGALAGEEFEEALIGG